VLTNIGGGYSVKTGMFTANQDGIYLFSFTVAEVQENNAIWADLMVNGVRQIETAAETYHHDQDVLGTNVAVIYLHAGDIVWVAARFTSVLSGDADHLTTSFTGVFLH